MLAPCLRVGGATAALLVGGAEGGIFHRITMTSMTRYIIKHAKSFSVLTNIFYPALGTSQSASLKLSLWDY